MAKANNKTKPTPASPKAFLRTIEPTGRRDDALALLEFFERVTGMAPKMWGTAIIGFGRYHYKYDSGREGEHLITGFSPRKTALTIYVMPGYSDFGDELARLGKHSTGKSCLYIKKLKDVDLDVLEEIIRSGVKTMKARYQTWDD